MGLRIRFENLTFTFLGLNVGESGAGGFSLSTNKLFKRLVLNNGLPPQPELAILCLICGRQVLLFLIPSIQNVISIQTHLAKFADHISAENLTEHRLQEEILLKDRQQLISMPE